MSKGKSGLFHGTSGDSSDVWNNIMPTQSNYPGTELPRSFIVKTDNKTLWVNGNATEHMFEYINKQSRMGYSIESTKLMTQMLLYDMQQSLGVVVQNDIIYGDVYHHGNWYFAIDKARNEMPYDAVIHALFKK